MIEERKDIHGHFVGWVDHSEPEPSAPRISTCCTCKYSWPTGTDGSHVCSDNLRRRIKELERAPLEVLVRWIDACKELPDSDCTVLIHWPLANDPVWLGYHDGETWRTADGEPVEAQFVDHWAQLPEAPPLPWHTGPGGQPPLKS